MNFQLSLSLKNADTGVLMTSFPLRGAIIINKTRIKLAETPCDGQEPPCGAEG
ncbi:hypothetical protein BH11ARM2_BH11ARM2_08000 [soil metagenome]